MIPVLVTNEHRCSALHKAIIQGCTVTLDPPNTTASTVPAAVQAVLDTLSNSLSISAQYGRSLPLALCTIKHEFRTCRTFPNNLLVSHARANTPYALSKHQQNENQCISLGSCVTQQYTGCPLHILCDLCTVPSRDYGAKSSLQMLMWILRGRKGVMLMLDTGQIDYQTTASWQKDCLSLPAHLRTAGLDGVHHEELPNPHQHWPPGLQVCRLALKCSPRLGCSSDTFAQGH